MVADLTFWLYPVMFFPLVVGMIFINHQKSARAAKDYYIQHIKPGDGRYYTEENATQLRPFWWGRGAEMQHLSGEVKQADFFALCDNENPHTGEQITPRNSEDRRVLTDFTFDAPKSVSAAAEVGGDDGKGDKRILPIFVESVIETADEMEADARTRVRKGGANEDRVTGNMLGSLGIHRTARDVDGVPDFQMHGHLTIQNMTWAGAGEGWKAIQLGDIVRDKGYYQSAFHARLASKLKDIGYGIERDGNSFRLAGIERSTDKKFSRRTAIIEAEAERLGIEDDASKSKLGRRTREKKNHEPQSMADLRKEWDSRLTPEERLAIRTAAMGIEKGDAHITPDQAKEYALGHSFQNNSAVSENRLKAEALKYAVGSVLPEDVADIAKHPEVITAMHDGQLFTTTKTVKRDEVAMLQFAIDGQRKQKPFLNQRKSQSDSEAPDLAGLSLEQRSAALHILNSRDTVTGLVGKAGTGKTTLMRATRDAIESVPGQRVFAFAPSSQASRGVLAKEGFRDATTLATLLKSEKMQEQVKGQVIWVDEAGQISSKDMCALMDVVKKGSRLILSGDYTQHSSVEAGDAFRLLEKEAGVRMAKLTEIRRQTMPGYKKAVEAISEGTGKSAQKGFDALDKMGWVIESPQGAGDGRRMHEQLVNDYLQAVNDGKSALIIAPTHSEGDRLTDELRTALKERGAIGKEREFISRKSTGWTDAQKGDVRNYEPGMVVEFHQNAKGFKRGEKLVVAEPGERGARNSTGAHETVAPRAEKKHGNDAQTERVSGHNDALTARVSDSLMLLRQDGSSTSLPLTQANHFDVFRTREIGIAKGDRIRITKNGEAKVAGQTKGSRLNNGDIFTVEGFTKEGDIRLENGKLLPKNWGHMSLGYVDTSYGSQGKTVDRVFIATGKESLPAANRQQWYVSASRGREMAKVYVDSKEDVREAIARTGQRLSAVELTHTKLRPSWRHRFHESLERNRVGRFLKARATQIADYWRGQELRHA
jgi:conjugative relaxase-like TrwC/TraI family protein